jgi:hypothetical protein
MQANVGAGRIYFWGQELEIARHAVAAGRGLDDAEIAATAGEFGLPVAGLDSPGYAVRLRSAAEQWMGDDHWLSELRPEWFVEPFRSPSAFQAALADRTTVA